MDDIEDILMNKGLDNRKKPIDLLDINDKHYKFILDLYKINPKNKLDFIKELRKNQTAHGMILSYSDIYKIYNHFVNNNMIDTRNIYIERYIRLKDIKSASGVIVITVVLSPYPSYIDDNGNQITQPFSCAYNCYYCPNQPNQPRSYLLHEPAVQRANRVNFDPIKQFDSRAFDLESIGHKIDKVEFIVLGGTWESYPIQYRIEFITKLTYAANTYRQRQRNPSNTRNCRDLKYEQNANVNADIKIVALKLETRPDTITAEFIKHLREINCTHIQIGIQHIDNSILKKINRQSTYEDAKNAMSLLHDNCFKIDIHLMPVLPNSTPLIDLNMFKTLLNINSIEHRGNNHYKYNLSNVDLQADEWKIYPCQTVPWTVIRKWYESGKYVPYSDEELINIIYWTEKNILPWIRINRIIRDIPVDYVIGGTTHTNMREHIDRLLKKNGDFCYDIRTREVKYTTSNYHLLDFAEIVIREYIANNGTEFFISYESPDKKILYGILRLRLNNSNNNVVFNSIKNAALIRQVHVYGNLSPINDNTQMLDNNNLLDNNSIKSNVQHVQHVQHMGIGKKLIKVAEKIAIKHHYRKIAVISSIGTRNYYEKLGYKLNEEGNYMIKNISDIKLYERFILEHFTDIVLIYIYVVFIYFIMRFS